MNADMNTERKKATDEQCDQEINAALRAVGHAEIPAGLSQRIAMRMKEGAGEFSSAQCSSVQTKIFRWRLGWLPTLGSAITAALLLAAGLQLTLRSRERSHSAAMRQREPERVVVAKNVASPNVTLPVGKVKAETKSTVKVRRRTQHYELISYPLTHQERLLLQVARTVDPKEVQMLNPEYRAAQEAKEEAEFVASASATDISNDSQAASMTSTAIPNNNESTTEEGTL